jgi:hypothetical protein
MEQKMNLLNTFERKKSTAAVACILNSTIGFGIGSFIQRDFKWAVPMLIMDIVADSCYIAGSLNLYYWVYEWNEDEDEWDRWYYIEEWAVALLISGVSLRTTTWVMALVRPIVYVKRYNRNLNSLLGGERMNVIFTPHVNFNENKYGVAINFTY